MEPNQDMEKRVIRMANLTWNVICGDVLENDMYKEMKGSEIIEIVMDADYMRTNGDDKEAYEWFQKQDEATKMRIMKLAFPYANYYRY